MTKSFDEYYLTAEQIKRLLGHTIDTEPAASSRNTKTTKSAHQTGKPQTKEIEPKKEFANEAEYRERLRELGVPTYRELLNMMVEPLPGRKFAEPGYNVFSRYAREQKVFQVPNQEFVMALSEHLRGKRVLEIGSGNGYLAECLRACDVNIIATDNRSWQVAEDPPYQVENLDYQEALSKFGHQAEVIICVWMPRDQNWMPDMLEANPDEIIAIGELDWDGTYGNSRLIMRYVNNDDPNYYDEIKNPG